MESTWSVQGAAGASGAKTATAAGTQNSDPGVTHILALKPATSSATLSINVPAGTQANDVMIASVAVRPSTATIGTPSGWTLVRRIDNASGQTNSLAVFRKVAASEPASYTWDVSGGVYAVGGIQSFSGVDTTTPIDVENGQATADAFTHATPSITTTVADTMIVTAHTFATSSTWTPPTGMTEGFDAQVQPVQAQLGQSIEGNYATQSVAGATGAKTATAAGSGGDSDIGAAAILALRPSPVVVAKALYFIHTDHLNTPRLIADASQQTVWTWDNTEPFGASAPNENPSALGTFEFALRFPGQYADKETNLAYNYFRDYDPAIGGYVQSDPIGLQGGLNTYAYVDASALAYADPRGECPWCLVGAAVGAGLNIWQQLQQNGGNWSQIQVQQVGFAAAAGLLGGAFGTATIGLRFGWNVVANTVASGAIGGGLAVINNTLYECNQRDVYADTWQSAALGGLGALAGNTFNVGWNAFQAARANASWARMSVQQRNMAVSNAISGPYYAGTPATVGTIGGNLISTFVGSWPM